MDLTVEDSKTIFKMQQPYSETNDGLYLMRLNAVPVHQWHLLDDEFQRVVYPDWKKNNFLHSRKLVKAKATVEMKITKSANDLKSLGFKATAFLMEDIVDSKIVVFKNPVAFSKYTSQIPLAKPLDNRSDKNFARLRDQFNS